MIVLQSFTAIASSFDTHQLDIEHIQTEHSHADDSKILSDKDISDEHNVEDCHHCGHCSGGHLSWILVKNHSNTLNLTTSILIPYPENTPNGFIEATLRPPIF